MITAQVERYADTIAEIYPLLETHWEELALDKSHPEAHHRHQHGVYMEREAAGQICLVTLRKHGAIVGYFLNFVCAGLHYPDCLTATSDVIYIHPNARGGYAALRLMRETERELRRRGVKRWFAGEKLHKPIGRLYMAFGLVPVEQYYSKWLGD